MQGLQNYAGQTRRSWPVFLQLLGSSMGHLIGGIAQEILRCRCRNLAVMLADRQVSSTPTSQRSPREALSRDPPESSKLPCGKEARSHFCTVRTGGTWNVEGSNKGYTDGRCSSGTRIKWTGIPGGSRQRYPLPESTWPKLRWQNASKVEKPFPRTRATLTQFGGI